jgi:hypothetical protein
LIHYKLDLRKSADLPGPISDEIEKILSDGGMPVGILRAEKPFIAGWVGSGDSVVLRKSSDEMIQ